MGRGVRENFAGTTLQKPSAKRKAYIDNLRLFCILLLFPYHAAMAWNAWGEANYILFGANTAISSFVAAVSPWYMPLLFVLAGVSMKYSLKRRSYRQFIRERCHKLLLPLLSGTLFVMPIMAYFADRWNGGYQGSYFSHYPIFFSKWTDLTGYDGGFGIGHLWFLLYLFVISVLSTVVIQCQKKYWPTLEEKLAGAWSALLLCIVAALLMPVKLGGKDILTYLFFYLGGYYLFSKEEVMKKLQKFRGGFLFCFLLSTAVDVYLFLWSKIEHMFANTIAMYCSGVFGVLFFLCFGERMLNRSSRIVQSLAQDSFLIYIFHFIWVIIFEDMFYQLFPGDGFVFFASVICAFIATYLTCQMVKGLPFLRFLFLGKREKWLE